MDVNITYKVSCVADEHTVEIASNVFEVDELLTPVELQEALGEYAVEFYARNPQLKGGKLKFAAEMTAYEYLEA